MSRSFAHLNIIEMVAYTLRDKKIIGLLAILSGILCLGCMVVGLVATQYDMEAFSNPAKLLDMSSVNVGQIRWFMLLDMFGYYLLLLPVVFYAHQKFKNKTAFASLFSSLGFGYVLIGAIGAAALAVMWPTLISNHALSSPDSREIYRANFILVTEFIVKGMWNYLEVLLGGIWWLGYGFFLVENRKLKIITIILGAACLIDSIGELFEFSLLAEIGLNIYLILAIVWPIWVGVNLLREKQ